MLIQPDTYIRLIKNCPLDKTYDHTIYFSDETNQINYFKNTLQGIPFNKQSYQRYAKGVLHIQAKAEDLYECNYLMFQNSAFGNKYFYAFVTSIEYVNNVSSKVYYELDVMQTWFFNYTLQKCFVEREHTETDNIGDNLIPERVETGEYTYSSVIYGEDSAKITPFTSFKICILASFDDEFNDATGGYYYSTYSGLVLHSFELAKDANSFINTATSKNKSDGIVAIFMIPKEFTPGAPSTSEMPGISIGYLEYIKKNITTIDGYTPRNKKLFTMPYNSLLVTNHDGKSATYGYEYFDSYPTVVSDDYVALNVLSSGVNSPEYCLLPWFYKGVDYNHMERVVINNTPQCGYNIDTFRAWLAQNKVNLATDAISDIAGFAIGGLSLASGLATLNPLLIDAGAMQLSNTFSNVANNVKQVAQHSTLPPTAKGNTGTGALNINSGVFGFSLYYCTIRAEYAKIIDDYFDMFGYAVNRLKVPNRNSRPHWNFVKTTNCVITGSIPADDASAICKIYNNGITFWKNGSEIGDYSLNNKPV